MSIRRIIVQSVLYTLYTLVAFVVCVYLLFPYDLLQQRLVEWLSQEGRQVTLTRLRPAFPLGLQADGLRMQVEPLSPSAPAVEIETLSVRPAWAALLSRSLQARFAAQLYGGRLEGQVRYHQAEGGPLWEVQTRLVELDVARHALLRTGDKVFIRGRLSGDTAFTLSQAGTVQDSTITLQVRALGFLGIPGWQVPLQREIACENFQGTLKTSQKQRGTVSLTCQSKELTLTTKDGSVGWKTPLVDSQLTISVTVSSEKVYKQEVDLLAALVRKRPDSRGELSFRLQGPLRQLRLGA